MAPRAEAIGARERGEGVITFADGVVGAAEGAVGVEIVGGELDEGLQRAAAGGLVVEGGVGRDEAAKQLGARGLLGARDLEGSGGLGVLAEGARRRSRGAEEALW